MSVVKLWHGVNRAAYNWSPVIDYDKCTSCGLCLLSCGNNVFSWSIEKGIPIVSSPASCVLGCTTCGKLCPEDAIKFPNNPKTFIGGAIKENRIFPTVRNELKARLQKFPDHKVDGGS